ncbi:glucose-1-phosphate thymidylyltransferase RfbA [Bdellovibrio reynosensis]|uniref:Glucose-1-phosphate thymidylyltransferase n=1 Tax=Bdellovibrio reynosensis TaxID=2835041 RepID=A0ABY4CAV8_9BACT|nr:glucose-1-phosphate thymidylyltransferase RfbA [Bdellovibrio reynosensis]UOF02108.1 glucose-1-phosphate thymidylyltransferase RfbA [Bdellovibrio reynosensis]
MKGIILAGGAGSRLYPMTRVMTKQLQSVYDKPLIYYPLSILMLGGIKDILLITTPDDQPLFKKLLGDGSQFGIHLTYKIQEKPNGLPEAFVLGEDFIGDDHVCLILGDNLFYGDLDFFRKAIESQKNKENSLHGRVFAYYVADPSAYGVVEFDKETKKVKSIEEKPAKPKSNYAVPGLYLFDNTVAKRAKSLKPSPRGETEIVDLILSYHHEDKLGVEMMYRGLAWLDTGTPRSLLDAAAFIGAIEERQGLKVACLEEVAYRMKFINLEQLQQITASLPKCSYRSYLEKIISEEL